VEAAGVLSLGRVAAAAAWEAVVAAAEWEAVAAAAEWEAVAAEWEKVGWEDRRISRRLTDICRRAEKLGGTTGVVLLSYIRRTWSRNITSVDRCRCASKTFWVIRATRSLPDSTSLSAASSLPKIRAILLARSVKEKETPGPQSHRGLAGPPSRRFGCGFSEGKLPARDE
jgi:hypothetical protein